MSAWRSASRTPSPAVRMMKPSCGGRRRSTISRSRRRSLSDPIRRDTPTRRDQGVSTRCRPGIEMFDVMRAPFVPIGSFAIWTMISWPSWRTVSMRGGAERLPRPPPSASPTASAALAVVAGLEGALEVVADVEEGRFFEADVDEGGLHAGEDAGDAPLHDVADDALVAFAFDVELGELAVLEQRNPGLPELRIDDDFVLHRSACSVPALRRNARAGVLRTKEMRRTGSREADRSRRSLCRQGRNGLAWPGIRLAPG